MNRTLSRRVERLETRLIPARKHLEIVIHFINADGSLASRCRLGPKGLEELPPESAATAPEEGERSRT
jgi:hypothetical protein